ncbi:DNA polymerase epsilon catalytic subunit A [Nymphaea thermarum]|nr:DNA polymerase epsilon catalytic subunit A [Nymphaea thermarum]
MNGEGRRRERASARSQARSKLFRNAEEELEAKLGFDLFSEGETRLGWLLSFSSSSLENQDSGKTYSCVDLYFVSQDGSTFKSKYRFSPYFYAATKEASELDVEAHLRRHYEGKISNIEIVEKEDLDLKNHLSGLHKQYLKISFDTVQQLIHVKNDLLHVVERNQSKIEAAEAYGSLFTWNRHDKQRVHDFLDYIIDLREYDVPYHVRFAIDNDVRCGQWYNVSVTSTGVILEKRADLLQRAEVHVCAFDIETTKLPLKFPDSEYDLIMMISYMMDGQGYLIINRECVGKDIEDLEYTPKPEFEGHFKVKNAKNERELLMVWFGHMQEVKPHVYVTYNGDFFDWPFIESRAAYHGIKMSDEIGFQCDANQGECRSKFACHLDCFAWVKRDSYLPQGSHGLKAVTKAKLGYDPLEVNPEDMVRFAMEQPQTMASYSVSDAVSTYYLYMTYVHPFIFSLATIIPMSPDEVLRKGSGTLCEMLLMVQAYKANVICPNKHQTDPEKFHNNRLLESETYIGGHVECLESGVFRSDLPTKFQLDPSAFERLLANLDRDLQYAIGVEGKMELDSVANYQDVKESIAVKLAMLRDEPNREECPLIYHLDVAAMYPNIILTNRLQPPSIVTDEVCTACDFNRPGKTCLRHLEWVWRGETFMSKKSEYYHLKSQIESELVDDVNGEPSKSFLDLPKFQQQLKLKDRLKKYCQKVYKRVVDKPITERRVAGICMRENPFYVDTVRRYEYKGLNKTWKGKLAEAKAKGNLMQIQEAQDMVILYDSLQLAHKCILNSFYGYVMRKGARWYSMEMAGVVTYTGAKIIQNARLLVEKIGRPLELDTDGIWCALPGSFPENFTFVTKNSKKFTISYPCVMLNVDVAINNTNDQYQTLVDPVNKVYTTHRECSIEFEVDGPYKAMILPASKEEGILIKKRYAVFNDDGTLAELKGFEIKRRGELKLIKVFQAEVFDKFLHGSTLEECYAAVSSVANRWLDLLDNQGIDIADSELLDYISESSTMSKSLVDYGEQKSCAVTTAKRLADFLGDTMVKDKGLRCQYIVACEPQGTPVSERAIPVAIFETDAEIMKFYVRKWCKISSDVGIRSIIDWSYYRQRLSSAIQKIITIPAAMQKVSNPVPRVMHPDWLHKRVQEKEDKFRQRNITDMFNSSIRAAHRNLPVPHSNHLSDQENLIDLEDIVVMDNVSLTGGQRLNHGCQKNRGHKISPQPAVSSACEKEDGGTSIAPQVLMELHQNGRSVESIDRNIDYHGWLEIKKRKWKETREGKKRQRLGAALKHPAPTTSSSESPFAIRNHKLDKRANGLVAYFRNREAALLRSHWQIIQFVPSPDLGNFFAWVVVEDIMFKVPLNVPRVFYLNTRAPITEEFPGKRVNKTLPHARPSFNLIEVVVGEDQYKNESKKLAAHVADPEVEGLYETKMPLEYSAILRIGCVCKLIQGATSGGLKDGWGLDELQMKTTTECSYLEHQMPFFYFYHSMSEGRGIFVIYIPASSSISVVVLNPYQNKELSMTLLEKQFREACQVLSVDPNLQSSGIFVKVDYVASIKDAGKLLQRILNEYRHQHHGPAISVIECPKVQDLKFLIPTLDDFPCVIIPCNARDSQYQALGWQVVAAKTAMQRCAASSQWLNERISLARYAHVLWISDCGIPDLGGLFEEDASFIDEIQQLVITYPGAYRKVTVELKIHHLAVNSLLKSSQLDEIEGGMLLGHEPDMPAGPPFVYSSSCFDEIAACSSAFRVLKHLIQRCLSDAVTSGNVFADAILQHLYRWICSPQSKLHDPTLHRVLQKIMQKVFSLLLAEFRKLGAVIIFADFSKIIVDTGKTDILAAQGYCECLLKALQSRDLFEWIELEPVRFWHSLLFMDQYNYGGIPAKVLSGYSSNIQQASGSGVLNDTHLDIDSFLLIVSEFIYIPWKYAKEQSAIRSASREDSFSTPSVTVAVARTQESDVTEFLKEQIGSYFTDKLLRIVNDIMCHPKAQNFNGDDKPSGYKLPHLGGSHMHMCDAALELIKHISAVFALDQHVQHDVLVMRKNLLRLIRVREFAPEAHFCDPCLSFTLPNVICSYCNDCRDLDLCRDVSLLENDWYCAVQQCGQPYNREVMENALLQIVRQRERLYHLQDLECTKCRKVKNAHLADQCGECAGSFQCRENANDFLTKMQVFLNVAIRQKFRLLEDCTAWILGLRTK